MNMSEVQLVIRVFEQIKINGLAFSDFFSQIRQYLEYQRGLYSVTSDHFYATNTYLTLTEAAFLARQSSIEGIWPPSIAVRVAIRLVAQAFKDQLDVKEQPDDWKMNASMMEVEEAGSERSQDMRVQCSCIQANWSKSQTTCLLDPTCMILVCNFQVFSCQIATHSLVDWYSIHFALALEKTSCIISQSHQEV